MKYHLQITRHAERDIREAADYIEFELYDPEASERLLNEVDQRISDLLDYPLKYAKIEDPVLEKQGIRSFPVMNYVVFYLVSGNVIYILRFLHQR